MTEVQPLGASPAGDIIPVIDTMPADLLTPLAVYLRLAKTGRNSFLLESVEGGVNLARYSFIGVDPRMIVRGDERGVEVSQSEGTERHKCGVYDFLRDHFRNKTFVASDDLPSFAGGAIGYMGFDCVQWFEPSLKTEKKPNAEFMIFDSVVAFDHARQLILIISLVSPDSTNEDAHRRNAIIRKALEESELSVPAEVDGSSNREIISNWTQPDFENAVSRIKELIKAGECYQVVLSQRFQRHTTASPVSIYRSLRSINPSPYMFLLQMDAARSLVLRRKCSFGAETAISNIVPLQVRDHAAATQPMTSGWPRKCAVTRRKLRST